ncbi:MAG: DeoR/GlpR family DNA-binding transcription regulator [bacterium]
MVNDSFLKDKEDYIIHLLETRGRVSIVELCGIFHMASSTIRRNLTNMEKKGLLIRTHGGAVSLDANCDEPIAQKTILNSSQKKVIAGDARTFIQDGDTIALGSGSTVVELCYLLDDLKNSIVLTNSVVAANILMNNRNIEVRICSGIVRGRTSCIVGPSADSLFDGIQADKAFIGTDAVNIEFGVCSSNILVGNVEHSMAQYAAQVFVLCDYSKMDKTALSPFLKLKETDCIITDYDANPEFVSRLQQCGVQVVVAGLDCDNTGLLQTCKKHY